MQAVDVDAADRVMRLAFGTIRGLADPSTAFGDRELVRTRYRAAPDWAWVAEVDGEIVGSVLGARWGSFGFLGPLTVHPRLWGGGLGSLLVGAVLDAFERHDLRQVGLFTFADSPKHLGLYQKHDFWPGSLTVVASKETASAPAAASYELLSDTQAVRDEISGLTHLVFPGLDVTPEATAAVEQGIGEALVLRGAEGVDAVAICHCGAGSEAGGGTCYVKIAAARPGTGADERFERLLDACEAFAANRGLTRLALGIDTGRLDAYRRTLARGFRADQIGVSMWLRPGEPRLDTREDYVISDLR